MTSAVNDNVAQDLEHDKPSSTARPNRHMTDAFSIRLTSPHPGGLQEKLT
jgi:hypothetical protein